MEIEKNFGEYKEDHPKFSYSITTVNAGFANNVIPNSCNMTGSIRSFEKQDIAALPELMEKSVKEVCERNGCEYKIEFKEISNNALINNAKCAQFLRDLAERHYGKDAVTDEGTPSYGSEDFADFLDVIPGCFFWRVTQASRLEEKLHTSKFNFDDSVIEDVAELFCQIVIERLNVDEE